MELIPQKIDLYESITSLSQIDKISTLITLFIIDVFLSECYR